jgi:uncharacterized protein (UPF0333 family)
MFLDNKGQASAEFIFITLIAVIVIGSLVSVIGSNQAKTQAGDVGGATVMGQKIAETVNTAYINGPGYSLTLNLSTLNSTMNSTANPFAFTAVISNSNSTGSGVVTVTTGVSTVAINLIPTQFNGTLNLNNTQVYTVTNVGNGKIQIV